MNHALLSARTMYRAAALITATGLLSAVAPAHATGGEDDRGGAGAAVLRTDLGVSLLQNATELPLQASLNVVQAPQDAHQTTLTTSLDGVHRGKPFTVLQAEVADAEATAHEDRAEGQATLVHAVVNLPGVPEAPLLEVEKVTSSAVCAKGAEPVAESQVLGDVTVLGRKTQLKAGGTTEVEVPGVGTVTLDLSRTGTTANSAAATALHLGVQVDAGHLDVAKVEGHLKLVEATCTTPGAEQDASGGDTAGAGERGGESTGGGGADTGERGGDPDGAGGDSDGLETQTGSDGENLAETGGSSSTPYLAGGAVALLAAGGGALLLARRRRSGGTVGG